MWGTNFIVGELCTKRANYARKVTLLGLLKENMYGGCDMDKVVSKIVDSMLDEQIISIEERDIYVYSLQMIIEKTIGYIAIFVLALVFDLFLPTVMFVIFFGAIRKYSGGFHLAHFYSCFLMSIGVYIVMCKKIYPMLPLFSAGSLALVIISCIITIIIGAINNPNIHWNKKELEETTVLTRYVAFIETVFIICMFILGCNSIYLWFMSFGILMSTMLLLIEKIKNSINGNMIN